MHQKIVCHQGRCFEDESIETQFDSLFDDSNIVEKIEHELWNNMFS